MKIWFKKNFLALLICLLLTMNFTPAIIRNSELSTQLVLIFGLAALAAVTVRTVIYFNERKTDHANENDETQ